jgi:hypothetical protein
VHLDCATCTVLFSAKGTVSLEPGTTPQEFDDA